MRRKNKIKRSASRLTEAYVKVSEKQCRKCVFSDNSTSLGIKIKCSPSSKPKVVFHQTQGWICFSFSEKV